MPVFWIVALVVGCLWICGLWGFKVRANKRKRQVKRLGALLGDGPEDGRNQPS